MKRKVNSEYAGNLLEEIRGLPVGAPIRVERAIAKQWLLNNQSLTCGGNVFYLFIRDIGLGICEVEKANLSVRETKIKK